MSEVTTEDGSRKVRFYEISRLESTWIDDLVSRQ